MNVLLERKLPEDHTVIEPGWLPFYAHTNTSGFGKKEFQRLSSKTFISKNPYDNIIKTEGASLSLPEEEIPLERFNGEISSIRADVAALKTDVAELKTDVAVLKIEVKHIAENTQKVPSLATDVAVIKNEVKHITENTRKISDMATDIAVIKTIAKYFIILFVTVVGGILVWYFTQR